ncbi:MAG: ATP-dependent zinc protease [Bacteroidetes bacterium]|nr:ATP-dependent zinc protease [Bacteroidota bacterium]
MAKTKKSKQLIGRRELVDFPDIKLVGIEAKIDTGAYTTALHCHDIKIITKKNKPVLCFKLLDPSHPEYNEQEHQFEKFSEKMIKNSFGDLEKRYVIMTRVIIAGRKIKSFISLTDRANMRFPVLIGRRLLKSRFIVDVELLNTNRK